MVSRSSLYSDWKLIYTWKIKTLKKLTHMFTLWINNNTWWSQSTEFANHQASPTVFSGVTFQWPHSSSLISYRHVMCVIEAQPCSESMNPVHHKSWEYLGNYKMVAWRMSYRQYHACYWWFVFNNSWKIWLRKEKKFSCVWWVLGTHILWDSIHGPSH
jgi:hypothetical protein